MLTIYHPEHPHYLVHKAYVEGCFAFPDNPPVVQYAKGGKTFWIDISEPYWDQLVLYRIKPRIITRTVTYPEPMRVAPGLSSRVWFVICDVPKPVSYAWTNNNYQAQILANGMCFTTEEDAQACYDALFGSQK